MDVSTTDVNLHNTSGKTTTTTMAMAATKRKGSNGKSLKVVYISSPMKVKTSASRFRSLVQRLTGIDSDVARYMEEANNVNDGCRRHSGFHEIDCDGEDEEPLIVEKEIGSSTTTSVDHEYCHAILGVSEETSFATSNSLLEPVTDVANGFATEVFPAGWFYSSGGHYPFEMDVTGNYPW